MMRLPCCYSNRVGLSGVIHLEPDFNLQHQLSVSTFNFCLYPFTTFPQPTRHLFVDGVFQSLTGFE